MYQESGEGRNKEPMLGLSHRAQAGDGYSGWILGKNCSPKDL